MVAKRCWILKNSWTRSSESWDQLTHGLHRFCDGGTLLAHVRAGCLAWQSGNTGCQALAVALRDMTLGEVDQGDSRRLLIKQGLLGLLNGIWVGLSAPSGMCIHAQFQANPNALTLGLVA